MEIKKYKRVLEGIVVSNKMDKTIVVKVERKQKHPLYGKTITKTKRYKAHDKNNECVDGDLVRIIECRPISKDKKFRLIKIIKKSERLVGDSIDKDVDGLLKREKGVQEVSDSNQVDLVEGGINK